MPRAAIATRLLSLSWRRGYAASAGAEVQQLAPAMVASISGAEGGARAGPAAAAASGREVSWMRDPKTGYWIPENRFGADVDDAAELRAQLLSRKS